MTDAQMPNPLLTLLLAANRLVDTAYSPETAPPAIPPDQWLVSKARVLELAAAIREARESTPAPRLEVEERLREMVEALNLRGVVLVRRGGGAWSGYYQRGDAPGTSVRIGGARSLAGPGGRTGRRLPWKTVFDPARMPGWWFYLSAILFGLSPIWAPLVVTALMKTCTGRP